MADEKNKSVAKRQGPSLADMAPPGVDGRVYVKLVKSQLLDSKGAEVTDAELLYFLRACQTSGLDPARREIYGIYRNVKQKDGTYKPKLSIQTSIDGFRVIAERSGQYGGSDEPDFDYDDTVRISVQYAGTQKRVPNKARVTVIKLIGNREVRTTRTANWADFYPGDAMGSMWKKFPEIMLAKVAEAQALRAAFPNGTSGLYIEEEFQKPEEADGGFDIEAAKTSINNAKTVDELSEIVNDLPLDVQKQLLNISQSRAQELLGGSA